MPVPAQKPFPQHVQFLELLTKFYSGEQIKNDWRFVGRIVRKMKKYDTKLMNGHPSYNKTKEGQLDWLHLA